MVEINNNGQKFPISTLVIPAAPGIFTDLKGNAVPFASGSRGQILTLFIAGEGMVSPALATGATPAAGTPPSELPMPILPVTMSIGNVPTQLTFVGIPNGVAGVTQVNFTVPNNVPLGPQPVVVTIGGARSVAATFTVTQ